MQRNEIVSAGARFTMSSPARPSTPPGQIENAVRVCPGAPARKTKPTPPLPPQGGGGGNPNVSQRLNFADPSGLVGLLSAFTMRE